MVCMKKLRFSIRPIVKVKKVNLLPQRGIFLSLGRLCTGLFEWCKSTGCEAFSLENTFVRPGGSGKKLNDGRRNWQKTLKAILSQNKQGTVKYDFDHKTWQIQVIICRNSLNIIYISRMNQISHIIISQKKWSSLRNNTNFSFFFAVFTCVCLGKVPML